jgi:hypothetical protein
MLKKIVLGVMVLGLVATMTPSASAACATPRIASTYNSVLGTFIYWHPTAPGGTLTGQTWQLGNYAQWNDRLQGTSPACTGNLYFNGAGDVGMQLGTNTCGTGCPSPGATLAYLAMDKGPGGTDMLLATIAEDNSRGVNWDYSQLSVNQAGGLLNMIRIPRPRVTASSRAGSTVNLQVAFDAISSGAFGPGGASAITGYKVLGKQSALDPGHDSSTFVTTLATVTTSNGGPVAAVPVAVDCTNTAQDQWIVTQLVIENGAVGSDAVSQATRVGCNPTLAEPKFKIVPKHSVGKTNKPNLNPND